MHNNIYNMIALPYGHPMRKQAIHPCCDYIYAEQLPAVDSMQRPTLLLGRLLSV